MVRVLPLVSIICLVGYLLLPLRAPTESELHDAYDAWEATAATDDIFIFSEITVKTKELAEHLRTLATPQNFASLKLKYGVDRDSAEIEGKWSADELSFVVDQDYLKHLTSLKKGEISKVAVAGDDFFAIYLLVDRKPREIPDFALLKDYIKKHYMQYNETKRWTGWLSSNSGPSKWDFDDWYDKRFHTRLTD
jgi:parvulin-like peptidyl-prolyl isomerase